MLRLFLISLSLCALGTAETYDVYKNAYKAYVDAYGSKPQTASPYGHMPSTAELYGIRSKKSAPKQALAPTPKSNKWIPEDWEPSETLTEELKELEDEIFVLKKDKAGDPDLSEFYKEVGLGTDLARKDETIERPDSTEDILKKTLNSTDPKSTKLSQWEKIEKEEMALEEERQRLLAKLQEKQSRKARRRLRRKLRRLEKNKDPGKILRDKNNEGLVNKREKFVPPTVSY